ncbi:hypothetical protein D3C87_1466090 [compost metagenome]
MLPGIVQQFPKGHGDDIGAGIEIDAEPEEDQGQVRTAVTREGDTDAVEHLGGADLHIGSKHTRAAAGLDGLAHDLDDGMAETFGLEGVEHVPGRVELPVIGQHAGIDFSHARDIGLGFEGAGGQFERQVGVARRLGHQRPMEHEEVLEAIGAKLFHERLGLIAAIVAHQRPGAQDASGDATEAVLGDFAELPDGGTVAAFLERFGGHHQLG